MCSLSKIAPLIKQCLLKNRIAKDILQITEFGFAAWKFLSAIYKSSWNKLMANKDNKSFRQYMLLQFNKTLIRNTTTSKLSKGKQADILRIPSPISPRPSKSMLTKSKFFNKNQFSNSTSNFNNWSYI